MIFGSFTVQEVVFGQFRLDGGCMFGSVPRNLWSKRIEPDEENCIPLVARSLWITRGDRRILVDCGMGELWAEPQRRIFGIRNVPEADWELDPGSVTDLILTHLHFDHAGGLVRRTPSGDLQPIFPNARIHLQRAQWDQARNPTLKDRASYLPETVRFLSTARDLTLHEGDVEVLPGLHLHRVDGHTRGQQWVEIRGGRRRCSFPPTWCRRPTMFPWPITWGTTSVPRRCCGRRRRCWTAPSGRRRGCASSMMPTRRSPGLGCRSGGSLWRSLWGQVESSVLRVE